MTSPRYQADSAPGHDHVLDPYAAAMGEAPHHPDCPQCAHHVLVASSFLDDLKNAAPVPPSVPRLPELSTIRTLVRARRQRRRAIALLAATLLLGIGLGGNGIQRQREQRAALAATHATDRADDALLRSLEQYHESPDIGGLGQLVDLALEEQG